MSPLWRNDLSETEHAKALKQALLHPSEQVHRVVLGAISDAVFITDDGGNFTYICPNVSNIFSRTFDEVAALGTIEALLGDPLVEYETLSARSEVENLELEIVDGRGRVHTLLVNIKKVAVDRGTMLYTCRDITERKSVERALAQANEKLFEEVVQKRNQLRNLTRRELSAQERWRAKISRELHDEAGQYLTALQIIVKVARDNVASDPGEALAQMGEAAGLIDAVSERIRRIAHGLRPPALDTVGLKATLAGLCREVSRRASTPINYEAETVGHLGPDATIALYRVVQECLTNAVKHSSARKIEVRLVNEGGGLRLTIADDGVGFDPDEVGASAEGLGLAGMRERMDFLGGTMEIESAPGCGARISVRLPAAMIGQEVE